MRIYTITDFFWQFTLLFFHCCSSVGMATSTNFEPIRAKGGYLSTNQLSVFRWYRFKSYLIDQVQIYNSNYCLVKICFIAWVRMLYTYSLQVTKKGVFDKKYLCIENYNIINYLVYLYRFRDFFSHSFRNWIFHKHLGYSW